MQISNGCKILLKFLGGVVFVSAAVAGELVSRASAAYFAPLLTGLLFGMLGDFLLAAKNLKDKRYEIPCVVAGIAAFFAGHICYLVYFSRLSPFHWLVPTLAVCLSAVFLLTTRFALRLDYGRLLVPCVCYCLIVMWVFVAAVFAVATAPSTATALLVAGASLFLFSDAVLAFILFAPVSNKKPLGALNLATYFPAQILIALSILFL